MGGGGGGVGGEVVAFNFGLMSTSLLQDCTTTLFDNFSANVVVDGSIVTWALGHCRYMDGFPLY